MVMLIDVSSFEFERGSRTSCNLTAWEAVVPPYALRTRGVLANMFSFSDMSDDSDCLCPNSDGEDVGGLTMESLAYLMHCSVLEKEIFDKADSELKVETEDELSSEDDEYGVQKDLRKKKWSPNSSLKGILFTGQPGMKIPPPDSKDPIAFFDLVFDDDFYSLVILHTNQAGKAIKDWKDVTKGEMKIFFGLLFHFGDGLDEVAATTLGSGRIQVVGRYGRNKMTPSRFLNILRSLTFGPSTSRLSKLTSLIDFFNQKMDQIYYPGKNLVIDNPIINIKDDTVHKDNRKRSRGDEYGLKLYYLSEPRGLVQKYLPFLDFKNARRENLPEYVTMNLLDKYLNKGHSLFTQKSFTSVTLAQKLLTNNTHLTGTLHLNRKDIPYSILRQRVKFGKTFVQYNDGVSIQLSNFLGISAMLSTEYDGPKDGGLFQSKQAFDENVMSERRTLIQVFRPLRHVELAWHRKFAIHIIQTMLSNSWLLSQQYSGRNRTYEDYREAIMEALINEQKPKPQAKPDHKPLPCNKNEKNETQKKPCAVCKKKGKDKMSFFFCPACPDAPGLCLAPCFKLHHI